MVDAELRSGKCDDVTNFPAPEDIVIQRDEITKAKFGACKSVRIDFQAGLFLCLILVYIFSHAKIYFYR